MSNQEKDSRTIKKHITRTAAKKDQFLQTEIDNFNPFRITKEEHVDSDWEKVNKGLDDLIH